MAEINFNQLLGQMNPIVRQNYEGVMGGQSFSDQYDPDKRTVNADGTITDTNSQNLTMKDGYSQMVDAYNQEQNIPETGLLSSIGSALNPFSELSASEMPQTYGLQNSMMGMSINPDGSLNYNNAQPQNLGFKSMVDMNNNVQNFDGQFDNTPMQMSSTGPFNFQTRSAPAANDLSGLDLNRFAGTSNLGRNDMDVEQEAVEPQYRIRDQLNRDFLQGGIPKDFIDGLRLAGSELNEDFGNIKNKIGSGINNAKEGIMGSSAMDFFRGLPTPGNLLLNLAATRNPLNPRASNYNIALQSQMDTMKDKGMYGTNPNTGLGQITGGRLAGKNLVSGFGTNDLGKMYGKDLSKLEGYLETMPQRFSRLMKNNPASYQKKIDNLNKKITQNKFEQQQIENAARAKTTQMAAANRATYGSDNATGGYQSSFGGDSGFMGGSGTAADMGSFRDGGVASMFTRRR